MITSGFLTTFYLILDVRFMDLFITFFWNLKYPYKNKLLLFIFAQYLLASVQL